MVEQISKQEADIEIKIINKFRDLIFNLLAKYNTYEQIEIFRSLSYDLNFESVIKAVTTNREKIGITESIIWDFVRECDKEKKRLLFKNKNLEFSLDKNQNVIVLDEIYKNCQYLHEINPYFYDETNQFWLWNENESCYTMVDEIDMLNLIGRELNINHALITNSLTNNYLLTCKQIGRIKKPENAPLKWLQFKNKAYSIESGNVYEVKPNYFFTNPIKWNIGETEDTPIMDSLITSWVGEKNINVVYQIISYCCYRSYPIQLLFCFFGNGRNGKTQLLKLIDRFIGSQNICSTELELITGNNSSRFETAKMYKKLVCLMGETNFGMLERSSILKKLVGGDKLGYEFKNKKPFDDYNYAKIIISTNSLPITDDSSDGFYRRWLILKFPNEFEEKGKDIVDTIPEIEYNNLAKKCCRILTEVIKSGKFENQGSIEERKKNYIMASNPLPLFISTYCKINPDGYVRYSLFYTKYCQFLNKNKNRVISKKEFTKLLSLEGFENRKTSKSGDVDLWVEGLDFLDLLDFQIFHTGSIYMETDSQKMEIKEIKEKSSNIYEKNVKIQILEYIKKNSPIKKYILNTIFEESPIYEKVYQKLKNDGEIFEIGNEIFING